jgi:hypothetical protein
VLAIGSAAAVIVYRQLGSRPNQNVGRQKNIRIGSSMIQPVRIGRTRSGWKDSLHPIRGRSVFVVRNERGRTGIHRDVSIPGLQWGLWSPDEKKVAFSKSNDESHSFYLANADGSNEIILPFAAGNMDWSRDSSKIVYQTGRPMQKFFFTLSGPEKFSR